jgi:hypothetical protein
MSSVDNIVVVLMYVQNFMLKKQLASIISVQLIELLR